MKSLKVTNDIFIVLNCLVYENNYIQYCLNIEHVTLVKDGDDGVKDVIDPDTGPCQEMFIEI